MTDFAVGDRVWIYDVNARKGGPVAGSVTKVGRKLVTVKADWLEKVFRIEDGRANDNYGHQWIKTEAQKAEDEHRNQLLARLRDADIRFERNSTLPTRLLERFVEALDAD